MTYPAEAARTSVGIDCLASPFMAAPGVRGDVVALRLTDKFLYSDERIPGYEFEILVAGQSAGTCTALIETDAEKLRAEGHVGVEIDRAFHGRDLPAKTVRAMAPIFQLHGMTSIMITCDVDSGAIHSACEQLNARYLDTIGVTESATPKMRYLLSIAPVTDQR